jgi:hypothetical protein
LTDLQRWIEYELDGYPNIKSAPDYRTVVSTELQYFNPYRGWCTAVGHGTFRFAIVQPVTELEDFAKRDHVEFASTKPVRLVSLSGDSGFPNMNQRYIISGSEFIRILGTVKSKLLAWSIELEQRNILGENMAFNEHEKNSAKQQTFNIQAMHGVIGDVTDSQINFYDFGSINQTLKDHGVSQAERNKLENLLDELKSAKPEEKKATKSKLLEWVATNAASLGTLTIELTKAFHALNCPT